MRKSRLCWLLLGGLVVAAGARACFFATPWQLLDNRQETLTAAPANSFAWEVSHFVSASPWVSRPVAKPEDIGPGRSDMREVAEKVGLGPKQQAELAAMRGAGTARDAIVVAGDLPAAVRLYTAGAVAFLNDDFGGAAGLFDRVLRLPADQAAPRLVWAQYMLGRVAAKLGDPAGVDIAFAKVRSLVEAGVPDPLSLATASLGETARLRLNAGDVSAAVLLYAEQAADGSFEAVESLKMVAADAMGHPDRLPGMVADPVMQRLLVVYALALTGDYLHEMHTSDLLADGMYFQGFYPADDADLPALRTLLELLLTNYRNVEGMDRLSALAYRLGDYPSAEALAKLSDSPLALWILAKIVWQRGEQHEAARLFAAALHASAQASSVSLEPSTIGLLRGETAVTQLARGDFVQAAGVLWPVAATYWGDFAYLAERVLTTDELRALIDAHATAPEHPADATAFSAVNAVRGLLARRLMRDGRYRDALGYFQGLPPPDPDAIPVHPGDAHTEAMAFVNALDRSRGGFWDIDRARGAWDAAVILRTDGMELMGTETSPDQFALGGLFDHGYGQDSPPGDRSVEGVTYLHDESVRYDASRSEPDLRYHYRYLAVEQALAAADLLPSRSQAFAAVLCQASGWMMSSHADERARAIYRRYVTKGAVVPFAVHFGHGCPEPDFAAVSATRWRIFAIQGRDALHRRKWTAAGLGVLLAGVAGAFWLRRARA